MVIAIDRPSIEEQIEALPADSLYEVVDGKVVEISHMGVLATSLVSILISLINAFAMPRRLGLAVGETLYQFRPDRPQRRPDVSFIAATQWPTNFRPDIDPPAFHAVPTLAVEVISPSNTATEIEEKRQEYFDAGVLSVWVVHPILRTIHVWSNRDECRVITTGGTLDGGTAIPGFQVKVDDLFAAMFPSSPASPNGTP